jgi:hypothetical protein
MSQISNAVVGGAPKGHHSHVRRPVARRVGQRFVRCIHHVCARWGGGFQGFQYSMSIDQSIACILLIKPLIELTKALEWSVALNCVVSMFCQSFC